MARPTLPAQLFKIGTITISDGEYYRVREFSTPFGPKRRWVKVDKKK